MSILVGGLHAIAPSWTTYAPGASAVVGFVLQQSALKTGNLAPAMASSNAVTLVGSVVLGITIFDEPMSNGSTRLAPALIGLAVALIGVVPLAGTRPSQVSQPLPFTGQSQPRTPPSASVP